MTVGIIFCCATGWTSYLIGGIEGDEAEPNNHESPIGYKPTDVAARVDPQDVRSTKIVLPYNASNDLTIVLVGSTDEPPYFFYSICSSSHKRLRAKGGSYSTEESSGNRLVYHRRGKKPVLYEREVTLPSLISYLEVQMGIVTLEDLNPFPNVVLKCPLPALSTLLPYQTLQAQGQLSLPLAEH
ncbi:hypothetical protein PVK06_017647 [Gossypium arboreum]|uniref:Uncharacterized protein n=1 Tax=Gossypium arboreum TaxID=29729 RepID=A0ABR0Q3S2_GOSAR|nr:hypothetical protein PVK06_017647 [Gossypium arboreum]